MFYVYALWSESHQKIYVGYSSTPDLRLKAHNAGKAKWTRSFRPWVRFHLEKFEIKIEAKKRERYLKSGWGRRELIEILERWQSGRMRRSCHVTAPPNVVAFAPKAHHAKNR